MEHYQVIWAESAISDLNEIIRYISSDDSLKAKNIFDKIKKRGGDLEHLPHSGRVVPELREHGIFHYRELIIPPWRLIYSISQHDVQVHMLIDSRRNVEDILLERLLRD